MKQGKTPPPLDLSQLSNTAPLVSTVHQVLKTSDSSSSANGTEHAELRDGDVQKLEGEIERLEISLGNAEDVIRDLQEKNMKLKDQLLGMERKFDHSDQLLQHAQEESNEREQRLQSQSLKAEREMEALKDEIRELTVWKEKSVSLTKQLERYRTEIERLSDAASRVAELENEIESKTLVESDLQMVISEVEGLKAKVEDLREKLAAKTAETYALESAESAAKQQIQDLRAELEQAKLAKQDMQVQVEDLVRKNTQGKLDAQTQGSTPMAALSGFETVATLKQKICMLETQLSTSKDFERLRDLEEKSILLERTNRILRDKVEGLIQTHSTSHSTDHTSHLNKNRLLQSLRECEASNKVLHVLYTRLLAQCGMEILKMRTIAANSDD